VTVQIMVGSFPATLPYFLTTTSYDRAHIKNSPKTFHPRANI